MTNNNASTSGIVLFAKQGGLTSFTSLHQIKNALGTKKVGHTGTLDSFADGLLVVMVGGLTRLASHVTAFDKKYEAIIQFGTKTDTLDPFGEVIEKTELPLASDFLEAVQKHTGALEQFPPLYSAIHIDGRRASDIARSGKTVEVPSRHIEVFSAEVLDMQLVGDRVSYAKVFFHVSKGTYIRSLARDIAKMAHSCAHLIALRRTAVGSFLLSDAVGFDLLQDNSIENAITKLQYEKNKKELDNNKQERVDLSSEIIEKLRGMTPDFATECGFMTLRLKNSAKFDFYNGKPLRKSLFANADTFDAGEYAVFTSDDSFAGLIRCSTQGTKTYVFVCQRD